MARLALNKSSLKKQRDQLKTFKRFLPSLDLKRQQLMIELRAAQKVMAELDEKIANVASKEASLLGLLGGPPIDLEGLVRVTDVRIGEANAVGVRLPVLEGVEAKVRTYSQLAKPFWVDFLVDALKSTAELRIRRQIQQERLRRLQDAVRKVTQRVNLFEKVLIPETEANIRKINIFLADGQRVAVVRSKIAKAKNVAHRRGES